GDTVGDASGPAARAHRRGVRAPDPAGPSPWPDPEPRSDPRGNPRRGLGGLRSVDRRPRQPPAAEAGRRCEAARVHPNDSRAWLHVHRRRCVRTPRATHVDQSVFRRLSIITTTLALAVLLVVMLFFMLTVRPPFESAELNRQL